MTRPLLFVATALAAAALAGAQPRTSMSPSKWFLLSGQGVSSTRQSLNLPTIMVTGLSSITKWSLTSG